MTNIIKENVNSSVTLEYCLAEISQFSGVSDWMVTCTNSYWLALSNGWLSKIIAFAGSSSLSHSQHQPSSERTTVTKEECLTDAKLFPSLKVWKRASPERWKVAFVEGWLIEIVAELKFTRSQHRWTLEHCLERAEMYNSLNDWMKGCYNSYSAARRTKSWFEECRLLFANKGGRVSRLTEGQLKESLIDFCCLEYWKLRRYRVFKQFRNKEYYTIVGKHFAEKSSGVNRTNCVASSRKHRTTYDWNHSDPEMVYVALENGWFEECVAHMEVSTYGTWEEFYNAEPVRFVFYYRNRRWEECRWLGLDCKSRSTVRNEIFGKWSISSLDSLKEWGIECKRNASSLPRPGENQVNVPIVAAVELDVIFPQFDSLSSCKALDKSEPALMSTPSASNAVSVVTIEKIFKVELSKAGVLKCAQAFKEVHGNDLIFKVVRAITLDEIPALGFSCSDEILDLALSLINTHRPELLIKPRTNFSALIALSMKLKLKLALLR